VFSQIWLNLLTDDGHIFWGTISQPVKEREGKEKGGKRERYREFFLLKIGPTSSHYE